MSSKRAPSLPLASPLSPANLPPSFAHHYDHDSLSDDDTDTAGLPFPTELARDDFISPDFSAAGFLARLSKNRHQTLADLRTDLQTRSTGIAAELHTLVNDEYAAFLSLGAALHGGEEQCQEVKVGILGFEKGVVAVQSSVTERRKEVERLLKQREELHTQIATGRAIIALTERVEDLEGSLEDPDWDSEDEEEIDDDDDNGALSGVISRLNRLVIAYVGTTRQVERLKADLHPVLLASINDRLKKIRETLLIDLGTALKQAVSSSTKSQSRLLRALRLYGDLDASGEALKTLKLAKTKP